MVAVSGILIVGLCYDFFRDFVSKSVKKNLTNLKAVMAVIVLAQSQKRPFRKKWFKLVAL